MRARAIRQRGAAQSKTQRRKWGKRFVAHAASAVSRSGASGLRSAVNLGDRRVN
jgi:hypothetical protein